MTTNRLLKILAPAAGMVLALCVAIAVFASGAIVSIEGVMVAKGSLAAAVFFGFLISMRLTEYRPSIYDSGRGV